MSQAVPGDHVTAPNTPAPPSGSAGSGAGRRRAVPAVAGLLIAGLALACVWPARHNSAAPALLIVAVAGTFAATGAVLARRAAGGGIGGPLVAASVLWAFDWCAGWQTGPLPALSIMCGTVFWVAIGWGCLRYPHARLEGRAERLFTAAVAVVLPGLGAASILVSRPDWYGFEPDVWWFSPLAHRAAFEATNIAFGVAGLILSLAFGWLVRRRLVRIAVVERRILIPVTTALAVAGLCAAATSFLLPGPDGDTIDTIFIPMIVTLLGVPLAFAVAATSRRVARAAAADLLVRLASPATVESVRAVLAEALHDDTVQVLYRLPDSDDYVDGRGSSTTPPATSPAGPEPGQPADAAGARTTAPVVTRRGRHDRFPSAPGRLVLPVYSSDGSVVAMVHTDGSLERQRDLVESAVAASSLAVENARLQAILRDQLARVRASRARVAEAGLAERRRVERDLHDGAQQRLLTLAAWLGLARAQANRPATLAAIDQATALLQGTLEELRRLARGIHPAILSQAGLETALDSAVQTLTIPVDLDVIPGRFGATVETVAYLTTWDALTHLTRAAGSARATVRIRRAGADLWVEVGTAGADPSPPDSSPPAIPSVIEDRLQAFDGNLYFDQANGDGLLLKARIPL